jgi:uncharacterized protein YceK
MSHIHRRLTALVIPVIAVVLLSGCSAAATVTQPSPSNTPAGASATPSATPSAAPTPTPTPSVATPASKVVAVITATAHTAAGASASLKLEIDAPHPLTPLDNVILTAGACTKFGSPIPNAQALPLTVTTTTSTAWPAKDGIVLLSSNVGGNIAWKGAWHFAQAACADGSAVVPGSAQGVFEFNRLEAIDGDSSWGGATYGFEAVSGTDLGYTYSISNCHIALGPSAKLSPRISALTDAKATNGCVFGGR